MKSIRYVLLLTLCAALIIPILFFTADNENYYYYYTASQQQINSAKAYVRDQQLRFDVKRRSVATSDGSGVDNSTNGYNGYSNGTGVNLMLLAQAQTGYAKEYLEILVKGEKGELGKCKGVAADTLLGIISTESNTYSQSNNKVMKSYLPWSNELNGPVWNKTHGSIPAEAMTLSKFGRNEYNQLSASEKASVDQNGGRGRNVFQLDVTYDGKDRHGKDHFEKSNMNSYGTDNSRSCDIYYFPDVVYWEEQTTDRVMEESGFDKSALKTKERFDYTAVMSHWQSSGSSIVNTSFGIRTFKTPDVLDISKAKKDPNYEENCFALADVFSKQKANTSFASNVEPLIPKYTGDPYAKSLIAVCLVIDEPDWYVTKNMLEHYDSNGGKSPSTGLKYMTDMYNQIFSKSLSVSEFTAKYRAKEKSYHEAIKETTGSNVSATDVERVYGIDSEFNNLERIPIPSGNVFYRGGIFHVSKHTSKAYKNKYSNGQDPYIISLYGSIGTRTYVAANLFGSYYYALMLKFAGVDVDPTNPDTYMKSLGDDTFVPAGNSNSTQQSSGQASTGSGGNSNGYDLSWIDREFPGVTVRGLTDGTTGSKLRRKYLATLYNWVCTGKGLQYSQNRRTSEGYVDCSSLTMRSLDKADIYKCNGTVWNCDGIAHDGFFVNSCFEFVPAKSLDDLQAGDALAIHKTGNSRHVFVFVGVNRTKDRIVCFNAKSKSLGVKLEYYYIKASELERKLQSKRGISSPARNNEDLTACPNGNWYAFRPKAFKQS